MNVRERNSESENMRSFSLASIYDKLELFKDLLQRISKNELGLKTI